MYSAGGTNEPRAIKTVRVYGSHEPACNIWRKRNEHSGPGFTAIPTGPEYALTPMRSPRVKTQKLFVRLNWFVLTRIVTALIFLFFSYSLTLKFTKHATLKETTEIRQVTTELQCSRK